MSYTKAEIIGMVDGWLTPDKVSQLYEQGFINYTGIPSDAVNADENYSEVIAVYLLKHLDALQNIKRIDRKSSYNAHHKRIEIDPTSPRSEEQTARSMMNRTYDYIGKIIDYQTPLKNEMKDTAGKIDLLSYAGQTVYILEFKWLDSPETLLRCVLEAYTYSCVVNYKKLLHDFSEEIDCPIGNRPALRKAALIYEGSQPHKDFGGANVRRLMRELGVDLFVLDKSGEKVVKAHYFENLEG